MQVTCSIMLFCFYYLDCLPEQITFFMDDISANYLCNSNFCLVYNLVKSQNLYILVLFGLIRLLVFILSLVWKLLFS